MEFTVEHRELRGKGSNRRLKLLGKNPGIIYGKEEPVKVSMRSDHVYRLIQSTGGSTKLLDLKIENQGNIEEKKVIIQDYQLTPWGGRIQHVDFREVDENTVLEVELPILISGKQSETVKAGGILQIIRYSIPVKSAVKNIPEEIEIDCSELGFGESIHVLDVNYPKGVEPVVKGRNYTIVTIGKEDAEKVAEETASEEESEENT